MVFLKDTLYNFFIDFKITVASLWVQILHPDPKQKFTEGTNAYWKNMVIKKQYLINWKRRRHTANEGMDSYR